MGCRSPLSRLGVLLKHSMPAVASVFPHTHTFTLLVSSVRCLSTADQQREPVSFSVGTAPIYFLVFNFLK